MREAKGFRGLVVWQKGMDLIDAIYDICAELPFTERFEVSSQIRRACVSVASNIAEGHERRGSSEFLQHLGISRGGRGEIDTLLEVILRRWWIPQGGLLPAIELHAEVGRLLGPLMTSIERRIACRPGRRA